MELLQLKYFCDAAVTQNFSATAKKFMVPPSDVSQRIRSLEKELGVPLFKRNVNKITLNKDGALFNEKASHALALLYEAKQAVSATPERERLKICVNTNRQTVMQSIEKFIGAFPYADVSAKCGVDPLSDEFDLIIVNDILNPSYYASKKILSEQIRLAVHRSNPIALHEGRVSAQMLADMPYITMQDGSSLYNITHGICREKYGFTPRIAIQSDDPFYVRQCVELNLGAAFVPCFSWKGLFSDDIIFLDTGEYFRDTYVLYPKNKRLSHLIAAFISILETEFSN